MSTSIDLEVRRPSRLHLFTGTIVLVLGYFALVFLLLWLKH
jgi:hypothetical protein